MRPLSCRFIETEELVVDFTLLDGAGIVEADNADVLVDIFQDSQCLAAES